MVSRRFACLFLAVSMTLSSVWIVSADQSHQIQDAAEAAASYSAAVQALEEAGLSQSAQANSNIAIDLGMLEQEETVDLSQLAVQAVQLQQEEEARQAEAARQANREAARRTGRRTIVAAGGVAANSIIRGDLERACRQAGCRLYLPPLRLCGDNGAMIGAQGYYEYLAGHTADLSLNAYATRDLDRG